MTKVAKNIRGSEFGILSDGWNCEERSYTVFCVGILMAWVAVVTEYVQSYQSIYLSEDEDPDKTCWNSTNYIVYLPDQRERINEPV